MSEREKLLSKISAVQFARWELHVYLDTHIDEPEAVKLCKEYGKRLEELVGQYEEQYGPLTPSDDCLSSNWVKNPWPWDITEDDC